MLRRLTLAKTFETPSERRGRLASDKPGEYVYSDVNDYVSFMAGALRTSRSKYSHVAKAGSMSGSTVSNLASGKTHYPRFSTMFGIAAALGYEVTIRGRK